MNSIFSDVIQKIDALNGTDPNTAKVQGRAVPYEVAYSEWVTEWVKRLAPDASEALLISARGQHVERWKSPRSAYPMDRGGYLRWREDLKKRHADTVARVMREAGYAAALVDRVQHIILKKDRFQDPDVQTMEDALCLVFLEHQWEELIQKTAHDKMVSILRKTWAKMSEKGHRSALALPFAPHQKQLLEESLKAE